MGQAAASVAESAVKEGSRCFSAPLDMTQQNVKPALPAPGRPRPGGEQFYALDLGQGHGDAPSQASNSQPYESMGGHSPDDAGGYYMEPMSQSELGDVEARTFEDMHDRAANLPVFDGSNLPAPPPAPPRPGNIASRPATSNLMPGAEQMQTSPLPSPRPAAPSPRPAAQSSAPSIPMATAPSLLTALPANPAARMAVQAASDEKERAGWKQGSILEIYSASAGYWYPALVLRVQKGEGAPDVLTMQFWQSGDSAKQKSLYRNDVQQLAPLGANLSGELPAGFTMAPSQSRPGQSVYQDLTTGMKYQTAELAWQTHFARLLERPSNSGMETVQQLPNHPSFQVGQQARAGGAPGVKTEYGKESQPSNGCTNPKQAAMVPEGILTEHGPAVRAQQSVPGPPQAQHQVHLQASQQFSPASEQRQQQHGSQLAAELSGWRPTGPAPQQPVHQYSQQKATTSVADCRAGGTGMYVGYPSPQSRGMMQTCAN